MAEKEKKTMIAFTGDSKTKLELVEALKEMPRFTVIGSDDSLVKMHQLLETEQRIIICHKEDEVPDLNKVLHNVRRPMTKISIVASILSGDTMDLTELVESIMQDCPFEMDMSLFQDKSHPTGMKHCKKIDRLKRTRIPARKPLVVRKTHP